MAVYVWDQGSDFQWDSDSRFPLPDPGSAPSNCGPTCVNFIAQYYRNVLLSIYQTRTLVVSNPYRGTSANEQQLMLIRRGVPANVIQPTVAEMHKLVSSGRRPIIVGLDMSKVPLEMAGHPFRGMHAVVLRHNRAGGFDVLDPNFSRKIRPDPTNGHRFYSDSVIARAFVARQGSTARGWGIAPLYPKALPPPPPPPDNLTEAQELAILEDLRIPADVGRLFDCAAKVTLRKGPGTNYPHHFTTTVPVKYILVGFAPNNWVAATSTKDREGIFFVPPNH